MRTQRFGIEIEMTGLTHAAKVLAGYFHSSAVSIMAAKENILYKALKIDVACERYCKKADIRFLNEVNERKPNSMRDLERMWYNGSSRRHSHYYFTRYHCLNLHSVFSKGTIEFRLFNSTLHVGEIKSYIQLCLAISHQGLVQKNAFRTRTQSENEKYIFRTWLLRLGMIGEEFKTARLHLLKNLEGNTAWKDPAQAEAQKKRLAARHEAEGISSETAQDETPPQEQTLTM